MLFRLIEKGNRDRFQHSVASLKQAGTLGPALAKLNVPVFPLGINGLLQGVSGIIRFFRTLKSSQPDLIVGWMVHGNCFSWLGKCTRPGTPIIWNIRQALYSMAYESKMTALLIRFCGRVSSKTSAIIYNSSIGSKHHEALGYDPSKRRIIANGFDLDTLQPSDPARIQLRRTLGLPEEALIMGFVGRYHPMKDLPNLIRSAGMLSKTHGDVHFVLAGKNISDDNQELTALIDQENLRGNFHLLGERHDIPKLVPGFDALVCCSYTESFPNVVGEAMACGVPVIGTDVGETSQIIGGTGFVVKPRDSQALANALQEMAALPTEDRRSLGLAARERIRQHYELHHIIRQYETLYESVIDEMKTA